MHLARPKIKIDSTAKVSVKAQGLNTFIQLFFAIRNKFIIFARFSAHIQMQQNTDIEKHDNLLITNLLT